MLENDRNFAYKGYLYLEPCQKLTKTARDILNNPKPQRDPAKRVRVNYAK